MSACAAAHEPPRPLLILALVAALARLSFELALAPTPSARRRARALTGGVLWATSAPTTPSRGRSRRAR
jgi:hypothetical protein